MRDTAAKVAFLARYIESVSKIAKSIKDDHVARVYGRALFLAVDSFTKLAPALKNELVRQAVLPQEDGEVLKEKIKKLATDYEGYYAQLRDKAGAHQQEVSTDRLLEIWNDSDDATLTILADDVKDVLALFGTADVASKYELPAELNDHAFLERFARIKPDRAAPTVGADRVAATRPQTVSMLSCHPTQEKAQRIVTAFDNIRVLIDHVSEHSCKSFLAHKATVDLIVVDTCSILDNLFNDDPGDGTKRPPDPSLLTQWRNDNFKGVPVLEAFTRDKGLEEHLRSIRNKTSAHLDTEMTLVEILDLVRSFRAADFQRYIESLHQMFRASCQADIRTRPFLLQGVELKGIVGVASTGGVKPFR